MAVVKRAASGQSLEERVARLEQQQRPDPNLEPFLALDELALRYGQEQAQDDFAGCVTVAKEALRLLARPDVVVWFRQIGVSTWDRLRCLWGERLVQAGIEAEAQRVQGKEDAAALRAETQALNNRV